MIGMSECHFQGDSLRGVMFTENWLEKVMKRNEECEEEYVDLTIQIIGPN